jgi:hypothetical protein
MTTECTQFVFGFHPQKRREIRAQFDGGAITSDGGGLLLREVEKRIGILRQFAGCFTDYRNPDLIEHTVVELVAQRVYGLAMGYEDLNDHEELRNDPLLAVLVEKSHPGNEALAGKSTLNRLELTKETVSQKERYKKIVLDHGAVAFLPWLLWTLLLPTVVHLLRRVPAVCAVAIIEHRCARGKCRGAAAHRRADSFCVAPGAYGGARGFWILPRGADGLV